MPYLTASLELTKGKFEENVQGKRNESRQWNSPPIHFGSHCEWQNATKECQSLFMMDPGYCQNDLGSEIHMGFYK